MKNQLMFSAVLAIICFALGCLLMVLLVSLGFFAGKPLDQTVALNSQASSTASSVSPILVAILALLGAVTGSLITGTLQFRASASNISAQRASAQESARQEYLKLAITILADEKTNPKLRPWAVEVFKEYTPKPLDPETLSALSDGKIRLPVAVSPTSANLLEQFERPSNGVIARISADGSVLATYSPYEQQIRLVNREGEKLHVPDERLRQERGSLEDMALSPDGKILATIGDSGRVWFVSTEDGHEITMLHTDAFLYAKRGEFSPDGKQYIARWYETDHVCTQTFDTTNWQCIQETGDPERQRDREERIRQNGH
jgi:uncharacterized membrane protein YciS (DUF1049 family)